MFKKTLSMIFCATLIILSSNISRAGVVGVVGERFPLGVINGFYDGLAGHSSSLLADISDASLAGVDLLWAVQPADSYTASELAAMATFLSGGGRIAFMGEHGNFAPNENDRISAALLSLGSSMSIQNVILDGGFQFATRLDGQILTHDLTDGVDTYEYAAFAPLLGNYSPIDLGATAEALMLGADLTSIMMGFENVGPGSVFLITDQNVWDRVGDTATNDNAIMFENLLTADTGAPPVIPRLSAPATMTMFIFGLAGIGLMVRRRRNMA